jgi:hypothetical protein
MKTPKVKTKEELILQVRRDPTYTAHISHTMLKAKAMTPYLRYGQILLNALKDKDLFYIEDDDLADLLIDKYEEDEAESNRDSEMGRNRF